MVAERVLLSYMGDINIVNIRPATVCGFSPRMRFDVVVNMLTIQALEKGLITVLGGEQERPHVHIQDIVALYMYCLDNQHKITESGYTTFNAGFENITVLDLAELVRDVVENSKIRPVDIEVKESNDPRSYHLNSDRIKSIGFIPVHSVREAIEDLIYQYNYYNMRQSDKNYNVRWMKQCDIR
jgi:Nucleoside-diphosphate-sugar epimerases